MSSAKPQLNLEITNFIQTLLPLLNTKNSNGSFSEKTLLGSCSRFIEEDNNNNVQNENQDYQTSLVAFVAHFVAEQREDGTTYLQSNSAEAKPEALTHYKEGLRASQWISGFLFSNDESEIVKHAKKNPEKNGNGTNGCDEGLVVTLEEVFRYDEGKQQFQEMLSTYVFSILVPSIAMISNGALSLIQHQQKYLQAQRWCERGNVQVAIFLKATGAASDAAEISTSRTSIWFEKKSQIENARKTVFGLGLKIQFRLGQALEGQNDFKGAIQIFEKLAASLPPIKIDFDFGAFFFSPEQVGEGKKLIEQTCRDVANKLSQCREKQRIQNESQRGKLRSMFA